MMNDTESPFASAWSLLSAEEQQQAMHAVWSGTDKDAKKTLVAALATVLNFRPQMVSSRSADWKIEKLQQHIGRRQISQRINYFLREYLIANRQELICAILDAEGTAHDGIWVAKDAEPPTPDRLVCGLQAVRGRYPDRDLFIYYTCCLAAGGHWEGLPEALNRDEFQALADAIFKDDDTEGSGGTPDREEPAEDSPESSEDFTTLDKLLINSVVATAAGTEGALSSDELEDLIQEIIALGATRHRSHFHRGFLDAVLDRELQGEFPAANVMRRGWYLTGFLMGRMRLGGGGHVTRFIVEHDRLWDELLASGPDRAQAMLMSPLLRHLAHAEKWRLVRQMLDKCTLPEEPSKAMSLLHMVHEHAADLVRRGITSEAIPLLEILLHRIGTANVSQGFAGWLEGAAMRKLGQALLRDGRFIEAKGLLRRALQREQFVERANALTDLGLAEAGCRSLDFALPSDDHKATETVVAAMEKHEQLFRKALLEEGRPTNANFILGLVAFHRKRPEEAEAFLNDSLTGMLAKETAYQTARLLDWNRFLLMIVVAERLEPARLNELREALRVCIESPAYFPLNLWQRLCSDLTAFDDPSLAETAVLHLLGKRGDKAYEILKDSGLLKGNQALRENYRRWLESQPYSPTKRAAELEPLLDCALSVGETTEAEELLDTLEGVAKTDSSYAPAFLELLEEYRSEILAVWSEDEIDNVAAALLERAGKLEECAVALQRMFYRARGEEDGVAVALLLEQLQCLNLPSVDVPLLRAQVAHLESPGDTGDADEISLTGVRVLYVGGNETQVRYTEAIEKALHDRHPGMPVTFYYPGWDSNVGAHMKHLNRLLPSHHVVVINNFVRTNLGRQLRAACDGQLPWRACTGHGRKSLETAIETAALWYSRNVKANG
jgi:tetratricopeptide (TPR) repeat protein